MGAGSYAYDWKTGQYKFNTDGFKQAMELMIGMKAGRQHLPRHPHPDRRRRPPAVLARHGRHDHRRLLESRRLQRPVRLDRGLGDRRTAVAGRRPCRAAIQQGIGDRYTISAQSENKDAGWEVHEVHLLGRDHDEMYEKGMGVMGVAAANTGESDVRGVPSSRRPSAT